MLSMCFMDIMNVLRTGMNMYISHGYVTMFVKYVDIFHILVPQFCVGIFGV